MDTFIKTLLVASATLALTIVGAFEPDAQSPSRPIGFEPVNVVEAFDDAPDARALDVQSYFAPYFDGGQFYSEHLDFVDLLSDGAVDITPANNVFSINPTAPSYLRVYFIGENAGERASLGFFDANNIPTVGGDGQFNDQLLIFPDTSYNTGSGSSRNPNAFPLKPMDYVDIGVFDNANDIHFFFIKEGGDGRYDDSPITDPDLRIWTTNQIYDIDPSAINYYKYRFYSLPGSDDILVRLDDGNIVDRDFNDLTFLIQVVQVPEPAAYFLIGLICTVISSVNILFRKQVLKQKKA